MKPDLTVLTKSLRAGQTPWEYRMWHHLRGGRLDGLKFKRQVPMGKYIVDFCCQEKKLIIELDGGQHSEAKTKSMDLEKQTYLEAKGYKVLRFWNNELEYNLEGVLEKIKENI